MLEPYDMAHKLAFAGARSPVAFTTGPEYTNSVPGVPVLSMLRVFIDPADWNLENVLIAAKEICRVLGSTSQFDVGLTVGGKAVYSADLPAAARTARLMKLEAVDPRVKLYFRRPEGDAVYVARFPRLKFEESGEEFWQALYAPGAVKEPTQP
jgi:hypothetical protein